MATRRMHCRCPTGTPPGATAMTGLTPSETATIRDAADWLRQHAYTAREQWTKAEARRLAEQLEETLTAVTARGQLSLDL